jgi:hypothetical protein
VDSVPANVSTEPADTVTAEGSLPAGGPQENQVGIVPPRDVVC